MISLHLFIEWLCRRRAVNTFSSLKREKNHFPALFHCWWWSIRFGLWKCIWHAATCNSTSPHPRTLLEQIKTRVPETSTEQPVPMSNQSRQEMLYWSIPRSSWKLAVIEELIRGGDGLVRAAHIRTSTRYTNRPVSKLYPLEVTASPCVPRIASQNYPKQQSTAVTSTRPRQAVATDAMGEFQNGRDASAFPPPPPPPPRMSNRLSLTLLLVIV